MKNTAIFDRKVFDIGNTLIVSIVKFHVILSKIFGNQNAVCINAQKQ